jgi:hypothetical protein
MRQVMPNSKSFIRTNLMILGLVLTATVTARADKNPKFLDIARNADGSVKYMNQREALKYCSNQGAHLPSARELTYLSASFGARGIVDSCEWSELKCFTAHAINADGLVPNVVRI